MWRDDVIGAQHPFTFMYDGVDWRESVGVWECRGTRGEADARRARETLAFRDAATGLIVTCDRTAYRDFPAVEWVLHFENTGDADTPIIENVKALDIVLPEPMTAGAPFALHRVNGAPADATDFEMSRHALHPGCGSFLSAGGGRSSNRDFPFFRIDAGRGTLIVAVGWSGQWRADLLCTGKGELGVQAGQELTRFRLHPGERVRTPRILVLFHEGEGETCHSQFRRLLQEHYVARYRGGPPEPFLYCNTCFTDAGYWLNECNEENQVPLIRALAPLGVTAVITDAGWFEGGWPEGAGNWTPRRDAYPNGMAPMAAAARECGTIYGLWFEPERVVTGTTIDREHPEWVLRSEGRKDRGLLNLGLPEAREYFFSIVDEFMKLPGFGAYRQDFNMDPLDCWRDNDAPDRQGVTEMKYIEGLYAYWDRIIKAYPDSFRVECAGGGRRIDLETIARMHVHQKSDFWFRNAVDQASLFALSHYLPNSTVMAPIMRLDDYTFHSVLPSSICLGWRADAPDFDVARARELAERYRRLRPFLTGDFYPLTEYSRRHDAVLASQYHRPDLDAGMVLVFRREDCRLWRVTLSLRGLDPAGTYELSSESRGTREIVTGADLMDAWALEFSRKSAGRPESEVIIYRQVAT